MGDVVQLREYRERKRGAHEQAAADRRFEIRLCMDCGCQFHAPKYDLEHLDICFWCHFTSRQKS